MDTDDQYPSEGEMGSPAAETGPEKARDGRGRKRQAEIEEGKTAKRRGASAAETAERIARKEEGWEEKVGGERRVREEGKREDAEGSDRSNHGSADDEDENCHRDDEKGGGDSDTSPRADEAGANDCDPEESKLDDLVRSLCARPRKRPAACTKVADGGDILAPGDPPRGSCFKGYAPTTRAEGRPDDDLLPPKLRRGKDGMTPYGRIRACICPRPRECRELTWRWARLGEARYVKGFRLPRSKVYKDGKPTALHRHIEAFREATVRRLHGEAAGGDDGELKRVVRSGARDVTTTKVLKLHYELVSMVHYHPEVITHLLDDENKPLKIDRYRIPLELGERIGMEDVDKCTIPDKSGASGYFALPTYSLKEAMADVSRAEEEYKRKARRCAEDKERGKSDAIADPSRFAAENHHLRQRNSALVRENGELKESLRRERSEKQRLQGELERLKGTVERYKAGGRVPKPVERRPRSRLRPDENGRLQVVGRESTDLPPRSGNGGKGGSNRKERWCDPRMDAAVRAKWEDPELTAERALREGGFEFPPQPPGVTQKELVDSEGRSMTARKSQLLRRLRRLRKMYGDPRNAAPGGGGEEEGGEEADVEDDVRMALVDGPDR